MIIMKKNPTITLISNYVLVLILAGCQSPGVVQLSPDTYMIFREDRAGVFGSAAKMKAGVIQEANEFARKQGKVAIPISAQSKPMEIGSFATFEYQFRVVDENDHEAKRTSLVPRADMVIERKEDIKVDLYTELSKLDDLRKKGIISEEEFLAQKSKLLNQ